MDRETLDEARATAAESEYYATVSTLVADAKASLIFVADHGGSVVDSMAFRRLLRWLRDDLDPNEHRRVVRAWLATCGLTGDHSRERDELRGFIRWACKTMGRAKQTEE
jgi:hypothetical protein